MKILTIEGMFIFAEVLAQYLESQLSRAALLKELSPEKLPVKLDDVWVPDYAFRISYLTGFFYHIGTSGFLVASLNPKMRITSITFA